MRVYTLAAATIVISISHSIAQSSAPSLEDVLASTENLTTFNELLTTQFPDLVANLSSQQQSQQYVTLLAPSDSAFDRVSGSSIGSALADNDTDVIQPFLDYHIIPGDHQSSTVNQSFGFFPTRLEDTAYTNVSVGQRVGFVKQGNNELIIISGGGSRSGVAQTDIYFTGGVMHVIDSPLLQPQRLIEAAVPFNLTGFLGAGYQNQSLAQSITEARDVTLFVPNNIAFEKVGSTVTSIDEASLSSLLSYHIIVGEGGPFFTSSFSNGTIYETVNGQNLTIRQASNSNFVNSARMLQTDLLIANGVMHVIDNVLNPNATGAVPDPAVGTQAQAMSGTSFADTPFTSIIPSLTSTITSISSVSPTGTGTSMTGSSGTRRTSATRSSSTSQSTQTGAASTIAVESLRLTAVMCGVVAVWMC
jgi:transforming growth factor-beta-induced protein